MELVTTSNDIATHIGTSPLRAEDVGLLRGDTLFTADLQLPELEGAAFVAFVRSPFAHARILSIDSSAAETMDGVLLVLTADGLDGVIQGVYSTPLGVPEAAQQLLPTETVRYAGEVVAAVVAENAALAADAIEMVDVEYEPLRPVLDLDEAQSLPASSGTAVSAGSPNARTSEAIAAAEIVVRDRLWNPRQMPAPMEARSIAAAWSAADGRLTAWSATQTPHAFRSSLSKQFDLPEAQIRVVTPAVGGGFGGKTNRSAEEHLVPLLARMIERPVRWNETRSENFLTAPQGRGEHIDVTLAGTAEGRITALNVHLTKDCGAYGLVGAVLPAAYSRYVTNGCYDIEHVTFSCESVLTNRPPTSAFRGAGRGPSIAALERMVDRYAQTIGMDPAEVRRINLIRPEFMPYQTPTGARYDEADHLAALALALDAVGYEELRSRQGNGEKGSLLGIGIASYTHMTAGEGGEAATVALELDGSITVTTGSTSQGHSHALTWAQITADAMGVPLKAIRVVEGDTDRINTGTGAVGSRSLQTAGLAVHGSATELLARAKDIAADHMEASAADIVVSEAGTELHVAGTPARAVSWALVAKLAAEQERDVTCGEHFDPGAATFPSGCHIAVVEIDPETFGVTIVRYVAVDDAGVRVNPMVIEGQLHGGIVSGAAQVLGETMEWDESGNPITSNFADYSVASIDQFPLIETVAVSTASSINPLGFKGVGESGTVGATPAVHNAIVDALRPLGVEHVEMPCTPLRIWEAVEAATPR